MNPGLPGIGEAIREVRGRVEEAARRAGRSAEDVRLCAVTKNVSPEAIEEAFREGQRLFGENRVQEARRKIPSGPVGAEWHMIGHLQTNKVRDAVRLFACIQSLDSLHLAEAIQKRLEFEGKDRTLPVLVEVNCSGEETKYGIRPDELPPLLESMGGLDRLEIRGLMTVGPLSVDPDDSRRAFALLRELRDEARRSTGLPLQELSMGMSADFEIAVEEGSTMVRIGSAIFGGRM